MVASYFTEVLCPCYLLSIVVYIFTIIDGNSLAPVERNPLSALGILFFMFYEVPSGAEMSA